jgi:diadenosine tetraphosphate (Ap4A) HIT family hydrolase
MPQLISRRQAIDRISSVLKPGECLVCNILSGQHPYVLEKNRYTTVVLSEYPRNWGQIMILLNEHKIAVSEITKEEWTELTEKCREYSVKIERMLKPVRCYISSLGAEENLPNTCPHIHFNLIPVYDKSKPSEIFTWEKGVYSGTEEEWEELMRKLRSV